MGALYHFSPRLYSLIFANLPKKYRTPAENRGRRRGATIFGASVKETIENPGGDVIYCTSEFV